MVVVLGEVLSAAAVAAVREAAAALPFRDGRATAGRYCPGGEGKRAGVELARARWRARDGAHGTDGARRVPLVARPRKFTRLLVSRDEVGMQYGTHVDDAVAAGARTELSFPLFLSEPDTYEGGALVMEEAVEARSFGSDPGDAILYPTSALHRVEPVTRGARYAVVGWVQSWVRDPAQREVLHDLDVATQAGVRAGWQVAAFRPAAQGEDQPLPDVGGRVRDGAAMRGRTPRAFEAAAQSCPEPSRG